MYYDNTSSRNNEDVKIQLKIYPNNSYAYCINLEDSNKNKNSSFLGHYYNSDNTYRRQGLAYEYHWSKYLPACPLNNEIIFYFCNFNYYFNRLILKAYSYYPVNNKWLHLKLGFFYLQEKKWSFAHTEFNSVLEIDRYDILSRIGLAELHHCIKNFESALKNYRMLLTLAPHYHVFFLSRMGYIYYYTENYKNALNVFSQIMDVDKTFYYAYEGLASVLIKLCRAVASERNHCVAREIIEYAATCLMKLLKLYDSNLNSYWWKLLSDALSILADLSEVYIYIKVNFNIPFFVYKGTIYVKENVITLEKYCRWLGSSTTTSLRQKKEYGDYVCSKMRETEQRTSVFRLINDMGSDSLGWINSLIQSDK